MRPTTTHGTRFALAASGLIALVLGGCVVAPPPPPPVHHRPPPPVVVEPAPPVVIERYAPPPGVVYVEPSYALPAPGYAWRYHPRYGWGWYHPRYGWHRGWN
ncbi:hypothetical protein ACFPPF_18780 [Xenophilus aerolatus]|jgi:hypothetical protein|nr:hypothetical protein [Xenophilus aerolatus]